MLFVKVFVNMIVFLDKLLYWFLKKDIDIYLECIVFEFKIMFFKICFIGKFMVLFIFVCLNFFEV